MNVEKLSGSPVLFDAPKGSKIGNSRNSLLDERGSVLTRVFRTRRSKVPL
jgi:hypothetical protein